MQLAKHPRYQSALSDLIRVLSTVEIHSFQENYESKKNPDGTDIFKPFPKKLMRTIFEDPKYSFIRNLLG